jgi:Zn-dependent peptidase ImmA (M78 family)/transcriptional regulator with XRE-family HTH domain
MASQINPEMLVVAREARGLTQSELAARLEASQARVSKWESGLLIPPVEDFAAILSILEFPEEFFFQTDRVYGFGSPCFYHRKRARMPVSELRQLQARLNIFRFQVTRLLRGVEIDAPNTFIRLDVDEHGGPQDVARLVRHQWGSPLGSISNVIDAVENAGAIVFSFSLGTRSIDAISQVAPGCPPVIFVNADIPADRLRFTLMHEVGHIIMHQVPSDDMEEQANRFAAEFLMPEHEIKTALRNLRLPALPALKHTWKVSMAALVKRAFDVGGIGERQYRNLMTELGKQGWRINEPVSIDREHPTVFKKMLSVYLSSHGYTVAELSRLVNAKEARFAAYLKIDDTPTRGGLRVVG